jgi:predicted transcriptional regulator of viral defense system
MGLFKKTPVLNFASIERIINKKQYPKQLIRNLILKDKIKQLTKGYYTLTEDPVLIVFCLKPSYLGLQNALSYHNLWEQETIPIIITTRKIRQGMRNVFNFNVLIRRINKKYLFGFDYYKQGDLYLPYSDIEKTFIDMIYFNENLSKEVIKNTLKKTNVKKLNSYLKAYPKKFQKKVLKVINQL